jgi:hypothetical protein
MLSNSKQQLEYTNHPCGMSIYNLDKRLCFVLIHKNASTTFKRLALASGWVYENYYNTDLKVDRYIVILRDPADRLLSATNMFITHGRGRPARTMLIPNHFYTEECHYEKQYKFVEGLNHIKVDFYYYTDTVVDDINHDYDLGFDECPKLNATSKLFNSVDSTMVRKIYEEDYALIDSVQFKNR